MIDDPEVGADYDAEVCGAAVYFRIARHPVTGLILILPKVDAGVNSVSEQCR
jgi:hypothetical protein